MPEASALGADPSSGGPLSPAQAGMLVRAEEAPEVEIVVPRQTLKPTSEVAPQQGHAADQHGISRQAIDNHHQVVQRRGTHEILPKPRPNPAGPDILLAGALRA